MRKLTLAILGATGAVGREMLNVLEEREVQFDKLKLFSAPEEAGTKVVFRDSEYLVESVVDNSFEDVDILLVAASSEVSKRFTPIAKKKGALVIDSSSAFRMEKDVPLVIPEVNPEDINYHNGIISNPNCSTIIAMVAVHSLHKKFRIKRMIVSTYQSVSGAGVAGIEELEQQVKAYVHGDDLIQNTFQHQIAFNLIPHIDYFTGNGYTFEEMKMHHESRKILHDDQLIVTCTCVRVPVFRSHSESIYIEFENQISIEEAKNLLETAKGVKLVDNPHENLYPMPLDTSNQDLIYIGRIRQDLAEKNALNLWCCGDQIRKGAVVNAIQIAELVIERFFQS